MKKEANEDDEEGQPRPSSRDSEDAAAGVGPSTPRALAEGLVRWRTQRDDQLIGPGHMAGDFLEAFEWRVLARSPGRVVVRAHLPEHVRNPAGQLFGGFTPTYVDLISIFAYWQGHAAPVSGRGWLSTVNMRLDYFAPITGPRFSIESRVIHRRGSLAWIETGFRPWLEDGSAEALADPASSPPGDLLAYAWTTLKHLE